MIRPVAEQSPYGNNFILALNFCLSQLNVHKGSTRLTRFAQIFVSCAKAHYLHLIQQTHSSWKIPHFYKVLFLPWSKLFGRKVGVFIPLVRPLKNPLPRALLYQKTRQVPLTKLTSSAGNIVCSHCIILVLYECTNELSYKQYDVVCSCCLPLVVQAVQFLWTFLIGKFLLESNEH